MSEATGDAEVGGTVVPIDIPTRGELWHRVRLAQSLLAHRVPCPETNRLVLAVLDGSTRPNEGKGLR